MIRPTRRWQSRFARSALALLGPLAALGFGLGAGPSQAAALRYCDTPPTLSAEQHDQLLRWAAVIKATLASTGEQVALMARSGLDLSRFGQRYSHAGVGLAGHAGAPWSVRQLYFSCDERQPRLYDQGIPGFVLGTHNPALGYVSVLLLPAAEAAALAQAATDKARSLKLLASTYSANAHAYSTRYQNCNQWLAELLASAWGGLGESEQPRAQSQAWLKDHGYQPSVFDVSSGIGGGQWLGRLWITLGALVPWLHNDDHPEEDLALAIYRVSMPASIEAFVRDHVPGAQRIEFCHNEQQLVIRRGWVPIADGCVASADDTVVALH